MDREYVLQTEIEMSLENIEKLLGPDYKLTLIAKYHGPEQQDKDMDIMLTTDNRNTIESVLDRFIPKKESEAGDEQPSVDETDYHQKPITDMTPGEQNSNLVILKAEKPSEFAHALVRIRFLKYPDKINTLFDLFQKDGIPMGSDEWTDYVYARYSELLEKEKTLGKIKRSVEDLNMAVKFCGSEFHREQSRRLTRAFQQRERAKEYAEHERREEGGADECP